MKRYKTYEKYYGKDFDGYRFSKRLFVSARIGKWRSSDVSGVIRDKIHILPSLCFYFNHSEVYVAFAWLTFECWGLYINFKREQKWRERMFQRS